MKKLFYLVGLLMIASTIFIGCRSEDPYEPTPPPPAEYIVVDCEEALTQTVYADEQAGESTVSFTTIAPWRSYINEVRSSGALRSVTDSWVTIDPSSGPAGSHNITINLEENKTGADRTVVITIKSGDDYITITITQRYVKECGTTHLPVYTFEFTVFEANERWEEGAEGRFLSEGATITLYRLINGQFEVIDELLTDAYGVATRTSSYTDLFYTVTKEGKGQLFDGFLVAGIFTSWDEVERVQYPETALIANPRPGSVKVVDIHGTGVITYADRQESPHRSISVTNTADTETVITTEATIISPDFRVRVEGVDINGIRWATSNVDMPGTFTENPEDFGMFFQWNRRVGWSSTDPLVNSDGGTVWDTSLPEGTRWYRENDPCPDGWRVPSRAEVQSLIEAGSEWTTQNGVSGRLFGSEPNQIFLSAAGSRANIRGVGQYGVLQIQSVGLIANYRGLWFNNSNILSLPAYDRSTDGNSIRCVEDVYIPVESVTLNPITLTAGEQATLTATVLPANATSGFITSWTNDDPFGEIVDVVGNVVTARSLTEGTATITGRTECGFTVTATVTVEETYISDSLDGVVIDGIRWATRNVDMPGTFAQNPQDAGMFYQWNRPVGWSSTDPLVNSDGGTVWNHTTPAGTRWYRENDPCPDGWRVPTQAELLSLISAGVSRTTNVYGLLFGTAPNQIFLPAASRRTGGGMRYSPIFRIYYWSSASNGSTVATNLWSNGGSPQIMQQLGRSNGLSVRCVEDSRTISLNRPAITLFIGEIETLTATTIPADSQVTWSSNFPHIATVDANGVVTAVSRGTAIITATNRYGYSVTCTVTVEMPAISLDRTAMTLSVGDTESLIATVTPAGANNQVTWQSSNLRVATVDANGVVTALSKGVTSIIATTEYGSSAICTVTVEDDSITLIPIPLTAAMLSTNAQEPTEGPIANLVDGNRNTHFHTRWSGGGIAAMHYFQVTLDAPVSGTIVYEFFTRGGGYIGRGDVQVMQVEASNDGINWTEIAVHDFRPAGVGTAYPQVPGQQITAPSMELPRAYSMLRFTPLATRSRDPLVNWWFNMGGFYLFEVRDN